MADSSCGSYFDDMTCPTTGVLLCHQTFNPKECLTLLHVLLVLLAACCLLASHLHSTVRMAELQQALTTSSGIALSAREREVLSAHLDAGGSGMVDYNNLAYLMKAVSHTPTLLSRKPCCSR